MAAPNREIELKFLLDPAGAEAVLNALPPGEAIVKDLVAVYYDTADHALSRAGFGLRVRRAGDVRTQTLKSALGDDGGRDEWDWPVESGLPDLAPLLETPAPVTPGTVLLPLFTVRSRRTIREVREGGSDIELVIDDAGIEAGDQRETFLELELELVRGHPADLGVLADRLARHAVLTPSSLTKAGRGYALLRR